MQGRGAPGRGGRGGRGAGEGVEPHELGNGLGEVVVGQQDPALVLGGPLVPAPALAVAGPLIGAAQIVLVSHPGVQPAIPARLTEAIYNQLSAALKQAHDEEVRTSPSLSCG